MRLKLSLFLTLAISALAQTPAASVPSVTAVHSPPVRRKGPECDACIHRNLSFLAGPSLHGRGSGTEDEHRASEFIAAKLRKYGLAPAAQNGSYIQEATIQSRTVTAPPTLTYDVNESAKPRAITWEHGKEITVQRLSQPEMSGELQKVDLSDANAKPELVKDGAVLLLRPKPGSNRAEWRAEIAPYRRSQAAMIIMPDAVDSGEQSGQTPALPQLPKKIGDEQPALYPAFVTARAANFDQLWSMAEGATIKLHAEVSPWATAHTWNVLAKLDGSSEARQIVLLSAHLDHLGVQHGKTYPGADDDASGTAAVMELARALAKGQRPKRTVIFALWGSEEAGMLGSQYFLKHPTFELKDLVANLEFEMIGRRDDKLKRDQLWLTGWDRTNFGPELAAHGAKLVADPHPEQDFFARSDNYVLAKRGIVAQTVSSYGLHKDYHEPTDTLQKIDWRHLDRAIGSMIAPVTWLASSDFEPEWNKGQKP